jgi:multiple sugar transport system substrate-binding protein
MKTRKFFLFVVVLALALSSLGIVSAQDTVNITFWSSEFQPERVERQQAIIDEFEAANPGIEVELVVMDENLMDQLMTLNIAAGTPPDVVLHPLQLSAKWYVEGLLDGDFATQVINDLGPDTFSPGALDLYARPDAEGWISIPSDGWGQMLVYRADLFEAAGLEPPNSYENILAAAEALHDPDNGFVGFLGANNPGEVYTWQVFEHIALANGATFVDADGNITFNTPEMIEAIEFYAELMNNYGQDESDYYWLQTRAEYLAGNGAMTIWSPFILDEMAGLRDSVLPTCDECEENPAYIAENSSVVSAISGYSSDDPAAWGSVFSVGIAPGASPEAQEFLRYWFNEAYVQGLAVAPEGKFPMRRGTQENPSQFVEGWEALEVGVDRRAPLSDFYSQETLDTIIAGADGYTRMGYDVGQSVLASAVGSQFFIQENLVAVLNGELTAEEAAEEIQIAIEDLQFELTE